MSTAAEDLLIIHEAEAEPWASYLRSVFAGPIREEGICCYDIATVSSKKEDFLRLGRYRCKLLILSQGMLEGLCQIRRFFLARVLQPAGAVVVLLCGVDSLAPLREMVPLGEGCLQCSSEQDAQEYLSAVTEIVQRGNQASVDVSALTARVAALELKLDKGPSATAATAVSARAHVLVVPPRVPCENPGEVFILLRDAVNSKDAEVEFQGKKERTRVKPSSWNDHTLCVTAPDFPAGTVGVTLYCGGVVTAEGELQYYSTMDEIALLLKKAADPMDFMFQAFQTSSAEKLDQLLTSTLMGGMPTGGFQGLQCDEGHEGEMHSEDLPTLLHFAAQNGLMGVANILLQCPGGQRALRIANGNGDTPLMLAEKNGHAQLHILLQEMLNVPESVVKGEDEDSSIYEMMGSADTQEEVRDEAEDPEEEDPYAPLGVNDEEYDTILTSSKAVIIANRPPAPTPRPETTPTKEDSTPFIAQVFQKKMSQGDADTLYSLPAKQAKGRDSISSTYDTFVPNRMPGLQELIELQEKVKRGVLTMDEALERFSDWQRVQKGLDAIQQEKLRQLRASIINNREDDENVYDKINIVHHTPDVSVKDCRRGSQPPDTDFYSKPLKGQHSNFFWKADKR
ncbi:B-cell scaffold protein with ankyrin repeats-like [Megalops cyprinoides]|uniref:B-cell scaffold protein with ankyrin repeats-like n=1 Tax=Megalops cyprinoides TaxID=118141 RepID=UPI001864A3E9|nr:B-cell scaffold protein with ankyrin repeats-like [Megalops cyprinoides]